MYAEGNKKNCCVKAHVIYPWNTEYFATVLKTWFVPPLKTLEVI